MGMHEWIRLAFCMLLKSEKPLRTNSSMNLVTFSWCQVPLTGKEFYQSWNEHWVWAQLKWNLEIFYSSLIIEI
jgi:hypothetical protein